MVSFTEQLGQRRSSAEQGWGLGSFPGGCSYCPAAPGMVQPLWTSSSDEDKEMVPQREGTQRAGQLQESHSSIWAELHRHHHHPAAKGVPTTRVCRQGHHPAAPLRTGWGWSPGGMRNIRGLCCPASPQSHGGTAWAEGKVLPSRAGTAQLPPTLPFFLPQHQKEVKLKPHQSCWAEGHY